MTWTPNICIHHFPCDDGFAAAWIARQKWPECEFIPRNYGQDVPDVANKHVLIADFSYKPDVLTAMQAKSIVILDHHKSAETDLADFRIELCGDAKLVPEDLGHMWRDLAELDRPPILALFDMDRCGSMMTWDFCFPDQRPPTLLQYIQDRDLWQHKIPDSRKISLYLRSYPYDFEAWDTIMAECRDDILAVLASAKGIERFYDRKIAEVANSATHKDIGGHTVPVANAPWFMASDVGHELCANQPFAAIWWESYGGRTYSLRSTNDGLDVSEIARQYGGGGHRNAAGFRVPA